MGYFENIDSFSKAKSVLTETIFENRPIAPRVTLAIPTYKRVTTLQYALLSALSQDFSDYEIIVVDNNPERGDETERFMLQYKTTENLSYYKNAENIGLFGNWNRCFEIAEGEWVTLLHDDDYYFPNYISTMVKWLDAFPSIQGLYCNRLLWYDEKEDKPINIIKSFSNKHYGITKEKDYMMYITHPIGPVGIFFKKKNVIQLGGYNPDCYPISDYAFNWRYHLKYGIYFLGEILVHYRIGINVSIKPETIEKQEEKNLEIRREYAKGKRFQSFLCKLSENTYRNNLAIAQIQCPRYEWETLFPYKKNVYYYIRKVLLVWNNDIYKRFFSKRIEKNINDSN